MMRRRSLLLLTVSIVVLACSIAVLASISTPQPVTAQSGGPATPWMTSANPPPGTSVEALSAPDTSAPARSDSAAAPQALISWRVAGPALRPRDSDVNFATSGSGGCIYATTGDAFTVWNTPISLPQGSTINTLRMYFNDTSASNSTAWFTIYDLYGNIVNEWSVSSNTAAGNSFNDSALIDHVLDYSTYSYVINWRPIVLGSTMQLCGFRLFYEPPPFGASFLPRIIK